MSTDCKRVWADIITTSYPWDDRVTLTGHNTSRNVHRYPRSLDSKSCLWCQCGHPGMITSPSEYTLTEGCGVFGNILR